MSWPSILRCRRGSTPARKAAFTTSIIRSTNFHRDLSVGSDDRTRVLSTGIDGLMSLESWDDSGARVSSADYGPYSGWNARAVADGSDGLTRVLWNSLDGRTGTPVRWANRRSRLRLPLWPCRAVWTAVDVSVGHGNTTHLLWTNARRPDGAREPGWFRRPGQRARATARTAAGSPDPFPLERTG